MASYGLRAPLMLTAAAACWGVGTVLSKQALGNVPPLTLLPMQLARQLRRTPRRCPRPRLQFFWPQPWPARRARHSQSLARLHARPTRPEHISASMSVLLWALEPAFILILAHLFLGDGVRRRARSTRARRSAVSWSSSTSPGRAAPPSASLWSLRRCWPVPSTRSLSRLVVTKTTPCSSSSCNRLRPLFRRRRLGSAQAIFERASESRWLRTEVLVWRSSPPAPCTTDWPSGCTWLGFGRHSATVAGSFLTLIPVFGLAGGSNGRRVTHRSAMGGCCACHRRGCGDSPFTCSRTQRFELIGVCR